MTFYAEWNEKRKSIGNKEKKKLMRRIFQMEIAPLMKSIEAICLILPKPADLTGFLIST